MPIKDVFLPLFGEPRGPALVAIEKCVAVAADIGARITALALEEEGVFERAVGDALPILRAATSVRVVTVAEDKTDEVMRSGTALVDHLREHGVYASFETTKGGGSSIGKVLGSWANSHGIDVIMMGAYHHSRLNEIVWGGVTKTVIGQPPCWVMISH